MTPRRLHCAAALFFIFASAATCAHAQQPAILNGVGIDQNLGSQIPLDAKFADETGRTVQLGDYFGSRPVVLDLVYFKCPGLCTQALNDLSRSLNGLTESAGDQFDVITVSFDPREGPELAADKKASYLRGYRRPTAAAGWHFLTGPQDSIDALTRAVGFHYRWDPANQLFAHSTALIVLTPKGKVSRYFYGVEAPTTDLHQAIIASANGELGKPVERILLYCFHYDPQTGKWGFIISRLLQVLGVITMLTVGALFWVQVIRARKKASPLRSEFGKAHGG